MSYGIKVFDSGGATLLDNTSRSARVVDVQVVTVPAVGSTNTYTIPAGCTASNSTPVLDNGSYAAVSSAGVASVYGSQATGTTTMRTYRYA